jgi:hypothetical protein
MFGINGVRNELKTGRAYSLAVVVGDSATVEKSNSPAAYWAHIGFHIFGCAAGIVLPIGVICEIITEHKRKVAVQKKQQSGNQ